MEIFDKIESYFTIECDLTCYNIIINNFSFPFDMLKLHLMEKGCFKNENSIIKIHNKSKA